MGTAIENAPTTELGGAEITQESADALIATYRRNAGPDAQRSGSFDRVYFDAMLSQPGCAGLRFYFGRHDDGRPAVVFVGIDRDGRPIAGGPIIDEHKPCPPYCGD